MENQEPSRRLMLCEPYLKIAEVATLLNIHRTTVDRLIDEGQLDFVSFSPKGGARRIPESSVRAYLERRGIPFMFADEPQAIPA